MYSRPTTNQIGPHDYDIKWGTVREMGDNQGDNDSDTLEMWIQKYGKKSKRMELLIHESIHGILDQSQGLQIIKGTQNPEDTEEALVRILGIGLSDWFRQNPDTIRYILQELGV